MEKRIIAGFLAALFVCLCGCAKTPDEVKANMRQYNRNPGAVSEAQKQYGAASRLLDGEDAVLHAKYQNLTMPGRISLQPVTSIPQVTFRQADDFDGKYREIMSLFFDKTTLDGKKITKTVWPYNDIGYEFDDPARKRYAAVYNNGQVILKLSDAYRIDETQMERVGLIHVDRGDSLDGSYPLLDKKYSVRNAVNDVQKWIDDHWAKYEPDLTFRVKTVQVRKYDGQHCFYWLRVEKLYRNIPLNELDDTKSVYVKSKMRGYFTRTQSMIDIEMMRSGTISSFNGGYGCIRPVKVDDSVKQFITLQSAAKMVEAKLSGFKDIHISDIALKYTLCPKYDYVGKPAKDDNGNPYYRTQTTSSAGITLTSEPVWAFILDVNPKEYQKKDGKVYENDVRRYVYVDVFTGALEIEMNYTPTLGA